jgi:glycerol dehydrogenase
MLRGVAERSSVSGETAHNEPFEVTADLLLDSIVVADAIGTEYLRETK